MPTRTRVVCVSSVPPLLVVVGYWRFGAIPRAVPVLALRCYTSRSPCRVESIHVLQHWLHNDAGGRSYPILADLRRCAGSLSRSRTAPLCTLSLCWGLAARAPASRPPRGPPTFSTSRPLLLKQVARPTPAMADASTSLEPDVIINVHKGLNGYGIYFGERSSRRLLNSIPLNLQFAHA